MTQQAWAYQGRVVHSDRECPRSRRWVMLPVTVTGPSLLRMQRDGNQIGSLACIACGSALLRASLGTGDPWLLAAPDTDADPGGWLARAHDELVQFLAELVVDGTGAFADVTGLGPVALVRAPEALMRSVPEAFQVIALNEDALEQGLREDPGFARTATIYRRLAPSPGTIAGSQLSRTDSLALWETAEAVLTPAAA